MNDEEHGESLIPIYARSRTSTIPTLRCAPITNPSLLSSERD